MTRIVELFSENSQFMRLTGQLLSGLIQLMSNNRLRAKRKHIKIALNNLYVVT